MNIKNKQELDEIIQYERDIYIKKLYPNLLNKNIKNKTLLFMKALRKAEYFKGKSIYKLKYTYWYMIYKLISLITNVSIPLYVFDKGLLIIHLQNIVVSSEVSVGMNCCLFHNTTIGIKMGNKKDGGKCPTIGSNVTICTGACVLGDIYIPNNCVIAANAVVIDSFVDEKTGIGGIPAKKISVIGD